MLLPNANRCVMCGTQKGEGQAAVSSEDTNVNTSVPTTSSLKFSKVNGDNSEEFEATITDVLGASLSGATITSFFTERTVGRSPLNVSVQASDASPRQLPLLGNGTCKDESSQTVDVATTQSENTDRFRKIFKCSDGQVKLIETRIKAKSKLDAARRVAYLFLLYNADAGRDEIPRAELTTMLSRFSLDDSNTRNWIAKSSDLSKEANMIGLLNPGREEAEKILAQVLDPNIENKWDLENASKPRKSKSSGKETESDKATESKPRTVSKTRIASKTPKDVESWVKGWKTMASELSCHDLLKSFDVLQKGRFGLWAIQKITGNPDVVVSRGKLQKFLHQGPGFNMDERSLERRLKKIEGQGELIKVKGGFQLLKPGAEAVEKSLNIVSNKEPVIVQEELDPWQDKESA